MEKFKQAEKVLQNLILKLLDQFSYADALLVESHTTVIQHDRTGFDPSTNGELAVKLRGWDGTVFREAAVSGWNPEELKTQAEILLKSLETHPPESKTKPLTISRARTTKQFKTEPELDPRGADIDSVCDKMSTLHARILERAPRLLDCQITLVQNHERKLFVNKYRALHADWTGVTLSLNSLVKAGNEVRRHHFVDFSNGLEVLDVSNQKLNEFLTISMKITKAKRIKPGKYKAVLHPMVSGLLAHESFGHGMEADSILLGRAKAADMLNKRIASDKVNICDDPSIPGTNGQLFFDDEGMLPEKTYMVKRGIIKNPLTDLVSASLGDFERTANGRLESATHKVFARMTNTFFEPGKSAPDKMIKSVKDGIYIRAGGSGMEDPLGWGIQISGLLCEKIKNGKLTGELYTEVTMGGELSEVLKSIKQVGNDFRIEEDAGYCGKHHKEWVRVSSGGPHLLIDGVLLS